MAIRKLTKGGVWLEQVRPSACWSRFLPGKAPDADELRIASLTPREREVIGLICKGLRNKEITDRLYISQATVSHHLQPFIASWK